VPSSTHILGSSCRVPLSPAGHPVPLRDLEIQAALHGRVVNGAPRLSRFRLFHPRSANSVTSLILCSASACAWGNGGGGAGSGSPKRIRSMGKKPNGQAWVPSPWPLAQASNAERRNLS
jgi:hypothetical protein